MSKLIEYRVRPVTRFIITRYHRTDDDNGRSEAGSELCGLFESAYQANRIASALHASEAGSVCFLTDHPDAPTVPAPSRE